MRGSLGTEQNCRALVKNAVGLDGMRREGFKLETKEGGNRERLD